MVMGLGSSAQTAANLIQKEWDRLGIEDDYYTGFSVYDVATDQFLFRYNGDNAFTPASNIKVLTMLMALERLPDTLTAAFYMTKGDSLIVWGAGDPGTYYPYSDSITTPLLIRILQNHSERIFLSNIHFQATRYGTGWAWDDYPYSFQTERTALPLYGNRIWLNRKGETVETIPPTYASQVSLYKGAKRKVSRNEWGDRIEFIYNPLVKEEKVQVPMAFMPNDQIALLSFAIGKPVMRSFESLPSKAYAISGSPRDTMIKIMMHESDNFIAEQLLLSAALRTFGTMEDKRMIDTMLAGSLFPIAPQLNWVDGSGLSPYNMVTPDAMIWLLKKLYKEKGLTFIKRMFPAGGKSGTIKDNYRSPTGVPYIYAKTGTLTHHHNLSGYLICRSGRILIFSWMNNQFNHESGPVKRNMEKLLLQLYKTF